MFIEKRKQGKKLKYYLVYNYRIGKKVKRISRYLGSNLDETTLKKLRKRAEKHIVEQIKEQNILEYELSDDELEYYKSFEDKFKIEHLQVDWEKFTKDFSYNTNAIEGSTVVYSEVEKFIDRTEQPHNPEEQEAINVVEAIEYIKKSKEKLSVDLIKKLHQICFKSTKDFAGKFREVEVVVKDKFGNVIHQGAPHKDIIDLLNELINWYIIHKTKYPSLLLASVVHNQFEKIHPFQDGNGRVGRLLLNYVLMKHDYPPVNILMTDRSKYYMILQEYNASGDVRSTIKFLISQYKKYYK